MKATFIHTSDIHLGIKINNKNFSLREREKRRRELWETFEKIINIAKEEKINYLFIAGDMISQDYCNFKDVKKIVSLFEKIKDTNVLITCGDDDSYSITSLYEFVEWPKNVHLFKNTDKVEKVDFVKDSLCVYSLSCGNDNLSDKIEQIYNIKTDSNVTNILLLHAGAMCNNDDNLHVDPNVIKYKFDYCALGHVHDYFKMEENIIYSGTPETYNFSKDNNARHGIIKGEIDFDYLHTEFIPISNRKFVYQEIIIEKDYNFNQILDLIKAVDNNIDIMKDYVKIKLSGIVSNEIFIEEIKDEARQFFYYIEFEDNYIYEKTFVETVGKLRGNIIDNYITQFENIDKTDKLYQKAFELGLQALKSEEVGR